MPQRRCDGAQLRRLLEAGQAWLISHEEEVNRLNVYPVPDGDTGTNMLLTLQAALRELPPNGQGAREALGTGRVAQLAAKGALMGARGNSGVILSQLLRGLARALEGKDTFGVEEVGAIFREAFETAYKAVMQPAEGTILSVSRALAEEAERAAAEEKALARVLQRVLSAAQKALDETPSQLPVLRQAGVVDAGGQGLVVILEGARRHLRGEPLEYQPAAAAPLADVSSLEALEWGYDTQLLIRGRNLDVEGIRQKLATMGNSLLVVGDRELVKVHIHTQRPGDILNYAVGLGAIGDVVVESMDEQARRFPGSEEGRAAAAEEEAEEPGAPAGEEARLGMAIVAVVAGGGMQRLFEELGATIIVRGGQTMNPSTEELLRAVERCRSDQVILLPNNKNVIPSARQVVELASAHRVRVLPSRTLPQGIAALLAFNFQADLETNVRLMEQALERVHSGEVTTATRGARVEGLDIEKGDVLGLAEGKIVAKGEAVAEVMFPLLEHMQAGRYELLTLYAGEAASEEESQPLVGEIRRRFPGLEVEVVSGGGAHYHYVFSLE